MIIKKAQTIRRLALFFAIMASGGTLLIPRELWVILTAIFALASLKWRVTLNLSDRLIIVWIIGVVTLQFAIEGYANPASLLSKTVTYLAAFLLLKVYVLNGAQSLRQDLFAILSLFALQAIITSALGNTAPGIFSSIAIGELVYYHIAFVFNFHYVHNIVTPIIRPNGLFYEPGVYQIYLSIFLFLSLFWKRDLRWGAVALCAVLTTLSTIGVIIASIQVIAFSVSYILKARGPKLVLGIYLIPVATAAILFLAFDNANDKILGDGRGSAIARQFDLQVGLNIVADNPLFGIGFATDAYRARSRQLTSLVMDLPEHDAEDRANSNGLLQIPISIGIPLALPLFIALFRQQFFEKRVIFVATVLLSLGGQSLSFTVFFLFLFFSGMMLPPKRARTTINAV